MWGEVTPEAAEAFRHSAERIYTDTTAPSSIGTLGERMLHAILKGYLSPDKSYHEQKVGRYHADILQGGQIWEIQTRRLDRLKPKLEALLDAYEITVVYPIAATKRLSWLDPVSGALTPARKTPHHGTVYDALYELYDLREFLTHPHFHFRVILCDMLEFRTLSGYGKNRKKRAPRAERIPTELVAEYSFTTLADYARLVPPELTEPFTAKELTQAAHLHPRAASRALRVLNDLGILRQTGKRGRAYLYTREEVPS
jgi:hypothetical protein